jgi:hypothetical protein
LRSNKKEKLRDKDNHSFDADAYLFDTQPSGHRAEAVVQPGAGTFGRAVKDLRRKSSR